MRTIRMALEEAAGSKISGEPDLWQWLVESAADTFNRRKISHEGMTPYNKVAGRESNVHVAAFGGHVCHHMAKKMTSTRPKSKPARLEGIYQGALWMRNEYVTGTPRGAIRVHSITRRPEEILHDKDAIEAVVGTPWKRVPGRLGFRMPTSIDEKGDEEGEGHEGKYVVIDHDDTEA